MGIDKGRQAVRRDVSLDRRHSLQIRRNVRHLNCMCVCTQSRVFTEYRPPTPHRPFVYTVKACLYCGRATACENIALTSLQSTG